MRAGWRTAALALLLVATGCATPPAAPAPDEMTPVLRDGFRPRAGAGLERLEQSDLLRACTDAQLRRTDLAPEVRRRFEAQALAAIEYPPDGRFLGDWAQGERIAQSGVGLQFSDPPGTVPGGNCYACHQIGPAEIAYGTLGPSLLGYGRLRGRGEDALRATWARLWNPHAFNACSAMPAFGAAGILSAEQIRHLMALLFDPESPVNR